MVADLFSGAGGFSRGFELAGFNVVVAVENDPPVAKTYKANFPHTYLIADDVKDVSERTIREISGLGRGDFDVVIASPPCEPFTPTNRNRMPNPLDRILTDPIGQLYLHAIRLIVELKPRFFVIENVSGVAEGPIRKVIEYELRKGGYDEVYFNIIRSEEHGVASERVRVFVSNVKLNLAKRRPLTVMEALEGLPEPGAPWPPNHDAPATLPRKLMRKVPKLRWGRSLVTFEGAGSRRFRNYIRLAPDRPAPTVMGSSRFIHPFEDRLLTVREQARLMGFPDYHVFLGGKDSQYNMVGEAVPVPLAQAIAEDLLSRLRE
ncbi:MAG: DNA cytosine methyltransferase [Acidilobus sp.]|nr:DNA cytosine methyltransferase [Acidilobus sp.]MCG2889472.1 DNA cytosine methyltransferase [Acidilobus sp.]MCG2890852.1 DNA cytosine methyltransferase [Acidilobus sp.]